MNALIEEFPLDQIDGIEDAKPESSSPYEAIRRSIETDGVLSPVLIHNETKKLIAGKSRCLACIELGKLTIPAWLIDHAPDSPEAKWLAIETDLHHKWFSELEQNVLLAKQKQLYIELHPETAKGVAGAVAKHGSATETFSFAKIAARNMNLSERQIQTKALIGEKLAPGVLKELDEHKSQLKAKRLANIQRELLALVRHPNEMQLKIVKRFLGVDESQLPKHQPIKSISDAITSLRHEAHIGKHGHLPDEQFPIFFGDFTLNEMAAHVPNKSVSLIATDMPYGKKWLHLLKPLFELYTPKLAAEGHVAIMYGQDTTPEFWDVVNPLIKEHGLVHRGQMVAVTPAGGNGSCMNAGLMIHHFKPIAIFAKPHKYMHAIHDTIYGDGKNEKDYYEWQQKVSDFEELITRLSEPGDLVVDVMAGSGTTGIAALNKGRRFLGFEIDKAVFEIAKTRLMDGRLKKQQATEVSLALETKAA